MLFGRVSQTVFSPSAAVITESVQDHSWEETCDPGRLWLVARVHDEETIIELWIAYITQSQKLICAPRPFHDKSFTPSVRMPQSSPETLAREALDDITGLGSNWNAIGSQPPNDKSKGLALRVLESIFSVGMRRPKVTVSAEGGVAIIYKDKDKYAAIESLNRGSLWMLWFDSSGKPQSRRINRSKKAIRQAVEQIALILNNA